jgi:predicted nucleotidyltransferase component of viral defense system
MIGQNAIIGWRQKVPWRNDIQVEQDLILHAIIQKIYSDPLLQKNLALRGGTCLNKLVWKAPIRYSEDLDLVQIKAEKIGPTADRLREVLRSIFIEEGESEIKKGGFKLYYSFVPETNPRHRQRIKIEINTREHFALDGYRTVDFSINSLWLTGRALVTTFSTNELFSTKLRALYQRRKGRDLFDLWMSRLLKPNFSKVVDLFLEYMRFNKRNIHRDLLIQNLDDKIHDKKFSSDITALIVPTTDYQVLEAAQFVKEKMFSLVPQSKRQKKCKK